MAYSRPKLAWRVAEGGNLSFLPSLMTIQISSLRASSIQLLSTLSLPAKPLMMLYPLTLPVRGPLQSAALLKVLMANYAPIADSRHQHRNLLLKRPNKPRTSLYRITLPPVTAIAWVSPRYLLLYATLLNNKSLFAIYHAFRTRQ